MILLESSVEVSQQSVVPVRCKRPEIKPRRDYIKLKIILSLFDSQDVIEDIKTIIP
jgi:hypothetical protein